ncbi:ESX secretion-associated protein EspG [Nocardia sp. NPDC003979]
MHRTWRLSGLEYLVLRERLLDRVNNWPFIYLTDTRGYYNFQFAKARTWGELQATWDPDLADLLVQGLRAQVRMSAHVDDRAKARTIDGRIVLSARRFGARAILMQGFSSTTIESHDEVEITECAASELSELLVTKLPPMAKGSLPRIELRSAAADPGVDHWHGRSALYDEDEPSAEVQLRRWQSAPKSMIGRIVLTHGHSTFGPRGQVTKWVAWEDHPGDGCYLIDADDPGAAVAADADGLRARVEAHCAELLLVGADETRHGVTRDSVFDSGR